MMVKFEKKKLSLICHNTQPRMTFKVNVMGGFKAKINWDLQKMLNFRARQTY